MINISVILPNDSELQDVRIPQGITVREFGDMLSDVYSQKFSESLAMTSMASGETYTSFDRLDAGTIVSGDTVIVRG